MVRPITTTKVSAIKRAVANSKEISDLLEEGCSSLREKEVDKVSEMFRHQIAYLRKIAGGFDSLELREKVQMIFVETAIELQKIGEMYLSLIEGHMTADLRKSFEKAGIMDCRLVVN